MRGLATWSTLTSTWSAKFRPCVDRVFTTHPGRLTHCDADVPVHVFFTLIFEFLTLLCDCMLAVCAATAMWC